MRDIARFADGNPRALRRLFLATSSGLILIGTSGLPARGQEAASQPTAKAEGQVEEVVVTARKRQESIQTTPADIFALTKTELQAYAINDLVQASQLTPGLLLSRSQTNSAANIYLRGVGSSFASVSYDQAVAINIDNVPVSRGRIIFQSFFDMQQEEVLKGPQALFFGKNSTAGVISVKTADPTDRLEFIGRTGYEFNGNQLYGEAIGSGPINDEWAARLAFRGSDMFGGFFKNLSTQYTGVFRPADVPQEDELSGRLTVTYRPNPDFDLNFKLALDRYNSDGTNGYSHLVRCQGPGGTPQPIFGVQGASVGCGLYDPQLTPALAPAIAAHFPAAALENGQPYLHYGSVFSAATATYHMDNLTFSSVTGFYDYSSNAFDNYDLSTASQVFGGEEAAYTAISEELRVASSFDFPLNFTAGLYYDNTELKFGRPVRLLALPPDPATGRTDTFDDYGHTHGYTVSPFVELIWAVTKDLELSGGARFSHETKTSFLAPAYENAYFAAAAPLISGPISDHFAGDNFSPSATVKWRPTETLTLYGSYRTGYKSGGTNLSEIPFLGTDAKTLHFDSETASGGEIGAKATLLNNSLEVRATLYDYEYDNLQVTLFDPVTITEHVSNAGVYNTKGIELDAEYVVPSIEGLNVHGSMDYNRATYGHFIGACYTGQTIAEGCNQQYSPVTGSFNGQDYGGKTGAHAPKWMIALGGSYDFDIPGSGIGIGLNAEGRYVSSYFLQETLSPGQVQGGYYNLDASVRVYDTVANRWEVAIIGRNLTDTLVGANDIDVPSTGSGTGTAHGVRADTYEIAGKPLEVALQFTVRY